MRLLCNFLVLIFLIDSSYSQGGEWSQKDLNIIREKIEAFFVKEQNKKKTERYLLAKEWQDIRHSSSWKDENPIPNRNMPITAEDLRKNKPGTKLANGKTINGGKYNGEGDIDDGDFGSFPNAAKFLRLGFHDCLTYHEGGGGCDGCLNPTNINYRLPEFGQSNDNAYADESPIMGKTDNNFLLQTADVLEQIYTDPTFPNSTTQLDASMKSKGYSRADLWAFAAMLAVQHGIHQNNFACNTESDLGNECKQNCMHIRNANGEGMEECMIDWQPDQISKIFQFRTGRTDCTPSEEMAKWRPFFADKDEVHPNLHANGPATLKFYKDNFGLNEEEAIALNAGAHSLGQFAPSASYHTYFWTKDQEKMLNNQVLRNMIQKDAYFLDCPHFLIGDEKGRPAKNKWKINNRKRSNVHDTALFNGTVRGIGPFQWVHSFVRCNANEWCSNVRRNETSKGDWRAWKEYMKVKKYGENGDGGLCNNGKNIIQSIPEKIEECKEQLSRLPEQKNTCGIEDCCSQHDDGLVEGQFCKREECSPCFGNIKGDDDDYYGSIERMEQATSSDMGFVFDFQFDEETGLPYGCPGFDNYGWKRGRTTTVEPDCPLAPTAGIVEALADDTEMWKQLFLEAMTKMVQNGYQVNDLHEPNNGWIQNENDLAGCFYKYVAE